MISILVRVDDAPFPGISVNGATNMQAAQTAKPFAAYAHHGELIRHEVHAIPQTRPTQYEARFFYPDGVRILGGDGRTWTRYTNDQWQALIAASIATA